MAKIEVDYPSALAWIKDSTPLYEVDGATLLGLIKSITTFTNVPESLFVMIVTIEAGYPDHPTYRSSLTKSRGRYIGVTQMAAGYWKDAKQRLESRGFARLGNERDQLSVQMQLLAVVALLDRYESFTYDLSPKALYYVHSQGLRTRYYPGIEPPALANQSHAYKRLYASK